MKGVSHVAVGAAIGHVIGSPLLGFIGGLSSHIVADMVPHRHIEMKFDLLASLVLAGSILFLVDSQILLATSLGMVGSVLPDVEIVFWKLGILEEDHLVFPSHTFLSHNESSKFVGFVGDFFILGLSCGLVILN